MEEDNNLNILYAGYIGTNQCSVKKAIVKELYEVNGKTLFVDKIDKKYITLSNGDRIKKHLFNKAVVKPQSIKTDCRKASCKVLKTITPKDKDLGWYYKWLKNNSSDTHILTKNETFLGYYRDKYIIAIDFSKGFVHVHNHCVVTFEDIYNCTELLDCPKYLKVKILTRYRDYLLYKYK